MALIGRHKAPCLGCGFAAPHVKKNEGKKAYVHCPDCGLTVTARNGKQEAHILAGMRPELHELPRRDDDIKVNANVSNPGPAPVPAAAAPAVAAAAGPATAAAPAAKPSRFRTLLG